MIHVYQSYWKLSKFIYSVKRTTYVSKGVSLGGSDPGSRSLFCQIPVSCLHYVRNFFVISFVLLDLIMLIYRFHGTII